jgi:acetyl-CoA C-acetyltransferase
MDPRTPVIVGAAQRTYREDPPQPLDQMLEVATEAAGGLLPKIQSVQVVETFSWPIKNPAGPLAEKLNLPGAETVITARGGNGPLALLGDTAEKIAGGELDVALLAGGEAVTPFMRAVKAGEATGWPDPGTEPDRTVGTDRDASHPAEAAAGLIAPIFFYPLIEHAHRSVAGRTTEEHVDWIASWWSRFSDVAGSNPHAWSRQVLSAEEIATPSNGNRLISSPYTKAMNANIQVDQAAAVVVTSVEQAEAAGIPKEQWVFVNGVAGGEEHWFVGERPELHRSPTLRAAYEALGKPETDHIDVYSCFPSAVETAALELEFDLDKKTPTVTGGLAFFGGPANNYAMHSLVTLVDKIRQDGGSGLATAVGWYLTKHAVALISDKPATYQHHKIKPQGEPVKIAESLTGTEQVESFTALYDRDGTPTMGIISVKAGDRRAFAKTNDEDTVKEMLSTELLGWPVTIAGSEFKL